MSRDLFVLRDGRYRVYYYQIRAYGHPPLNEDPQYILLGNTLPKETQYLQMYFE